MEIKCKICGFVTKKMDNSKSNQDYYYCSNCEFIFKDELCILSLNDQKTRYGLHQNHIDDPVYLQYFNRFLDEAVIKYLNNPKDCLDFGSGPEPVLANILRNKYNYHVDIYDLHFSPEKIYEDKKYDLITLTEVVEHLEDPLNYFKLFYELLNDDGVLAITTSFHLNNLERFFSWYYIRDTTHISFFSKYTLEYIAKTIGFEVLYSNNKSYMTLRKIKCH